jgi:hypothetical protein
MRLAKSLRTKVLKFESAVEHYPNILVPAKTTLPKWVKDTPKWKDTKPNADAIGKTFKHCSSFLDTFIVGYVVTLPYDIVVEQTEFGPHLKWPINEPLVRVRDGDTNSSIPTPTGYSPLHFIWEFPVAIEIPKGYSLLLAHPFNQHQLPFLTLSGIVDGEFVVSAGGNVPFFVSSSFEGVIPQGTPIAQVLPFKRESWSLKATPGVLKKGQLFGRSSISRIQGWYKANIWVKKHYL